ncbi:MAG: hypothetical protein AB1942_15965 [Pseudomonadota bacterium]
MTDKTTKTLARATALTLAAALALGPAAGAQTRTTSSWQQVLIVPEPFIPAPPPPPPPPPTVEQTELQAQLAITARIANEYLRRSAKNNDYDKTTGALMVLSGFYGAAVTAFNPAPKNLKAAILATGTFTGLNTGFKFRERSRAYRQGHRAMACIVETGAPLLSYQPTTSTKVVNLRKEAADALATADLALLSATSSTTTPLLANKTTESQINALIARLEGQADSAERKVLEERMKVLVALDRTLAEEQGAFEGVGARTSQVRRLGRIDIQRIQIMAAAMWTKAA